MQGIGRKRDSYENINIKLKYKMKKTLLFGLLAVLGATAVQAEETPQVYYPIADDEKGDYTLGAVTGVSANGKYAVINDNDNFLSYLWDITNPTVMTDIGGSQKVNAYDVNDLGMIVGEVRGAGGATRPIVIKNGEIIMLPVLPTLLNTSQALRINNDGTVIGGVQYIKDPNNESGGGYRACIWKLEGEEYVLYPYETIPEVLVGHQGYMMTDMSEDGNMIFGFMMCAATQCEIPCMIVDGEYIYWNRVEKRMEEFFYKDKSLGFFEEWYVDGYHDTDSQHNFQGRFNYYDEKTGKAYGYRTVASNVQEDGTGTLTTGAFVYDVATGTFEDMFDYYAFAYADEDVIFGANINAMANGYEPFALVDGVRKTQEEVLGVDLDVNFQGVNYASTDGNVYGGNHGILNEATMYLDYYPVIVVEKPWSGVEEVAAVAAGETQVFDLQGRLVATGENMPTVAGFYVVKTGENVKKVIVK